MYGVEDALILLEDLTLLLKREGLIIRVGKVVVLLGATLITIEVVSGLIKLELGVRFMARETKQVILVRKDLNMPPGKLAAQVAHASLGVFTSEFNRYCNDTVNMLIPEYGPMDTWLEHSFTKICLGVKDLQGLDELYAVAKELKVPTCRITDEGRTIFGKPTTTCCAIGPWWSDELDEITGHLRLL